jgi:archaeal flagellar protein FlaJ
MSTRIRDYCRNIGLLLDEISTYERFRENLRKQIDFLDKQYQRGDLTYSEYVKVKGKLLSDQSSAKALKSYDDQIDQLLLNVDTINDRILKEVYQDIPSVMRSPAKRPSSAGRQQSRKLPDIGKPRGPEPAGSVEESFRKDVERFLSAPVESREVYAQDFGVPEIRTDFGQVPVQASPSGQETQAQKDFEKQLHRKGIFKKQPDPNKKEEEKPQMPLLDIVPKAENESEQLEDGQRSISPVPEPPTEAMDLIPIGYADDEVEDARKEALNKPKRPADPFHEALKDTAYSGETDKTAQNMLHPPFPHKIEELAIPEPKKLPFPKNIIYAFQSKEKPILDRFTGKEENVMFSGILNKEALQFFLTGKQDQKSNAFLSDSQSKVMPSIFAYEDKLGDVEGLDEVAKDDISNPYLLEKEVKSLKTLIQKKPPKIYRPSSVGYLANITVRKLSIYFIEKYPAFFKKLYIAIRHANIKVLSNTYINIMFLLLLTTFFFSIPICTILFSFQDSNVFLIIAKTLLVATLLSLGVFFGAYYYPFSLIKKRKASINTNLPFAIDHMSSVIASGVPPATIFKLISASKEYGEISVEMEKISNYVDVFGYDLLTAIRAISYTTPSEELKEFFDGFISNIETGGELKTYLNQKSKEALMQYRLKRQTYVESLSTYSDIYTGVLIAAPLFFVTAFSLVSVLGGNIGGMDVNVIISVGTYLVIPLLNVLFIVFLEMNQPEI